MILRGSTVKRMEEEISRGCSTSPEFGGSFKSRNSSPEVYDNRKQSNVGYPINKISGVTKVSQIYHDNSSVYYPRRKSEFEKSKTFRRLQLELGESSPEPNEPDEVSKIRENSGERRSSSSSPILDRSNVYDKERYPMQDRFSSHREKSIASVERRKSSDFKKSSFDSSTYSSRRRSSSSTPIIDNDYSRERPTSDERSESQTEIHNPIYREERISKIDEKRRRNDKSVSDIYCSTEKRSSSSSPMADYDYNFAKEKSPEFQRSKSPAGRRESTLKNPGNEPRNAGNQNSKFDSNAFKHRSNPWNPINKRDFSKDFQSRNERTFESVNDERKTRIRKIGKNEDARIPSEIIDKSTFNSTGRYNSDSTVNNELPQKREKSIERPGSRNDFQRSIYRRETNLRDTETSLNHGNDVSRYGTSTFSSRIRSSSPMTTSANYDSSEPRKTSHQISHGHQKSRGRSHGPIDRGVSILSDNEPKGTKNKTAKTTPNAGSDTFSIRHQSPPPITIERKTSAEKSVEYLENHERSKSPNRRQESTEKFDERKNTNGTTSNYASSTYSSRQHSSSPTEDRESSTKRTIVKATSHDNQRSADRSRSPDHRNVKTSNFEPCDYSSRRISSTSMDDYGTPKDRRMSGEQSPEHWTSRNHSQSLMTQKRSIVNDADEKMIYDNGKTSNFTSSTLSSRRNSIYPDPFDDSPKEADTDYRSNVRIENRRKSGETLRSYELIQKIVKSGGTEKREATTKRRESSERKITSRDAESSDLRDESKIDESAMIRKVVKNEKSSTLLNYNERKSTKPGKIPRNPESKTVSPLVSKGTRETNFFSGKKDPPMKSNDGKKIESRNRQDFLEVKSTEKSIIDTGNRRSNDEKESKKSLSEKVIKRRDTFRITKPKSDALENVRINRDQEESSLEKKTQNGIKENRQLLERIEKIRSTISRTDRSDQNLGSKDFERTDSVESALKRFDSIGVETEHHVTVGIDETDLDKPLVVSGIPYMSENGIPVNEEIVVKKTIAPLCKLAKTADSKKNRVESKDTEITSRKKQARLESREKEGKSIKSSKIRKNETILRKAAGGYSEEKMAAKSREKEKRVTSMVKRSKIHEEEFTGRREGRRIDDSPICKKKLFEDSVSELENEDSRSTIVLTTTTRLTNVSPDIVEYETKNHCETVNNETEMISRSKTPSLVDTNVEIEPQKMLRSIEDIRKSIKRESEDLERQIERFNETVEMNCEGDPKECQNDRNATAGTLSRVQITKTFKSGDKVPIVKIEKTIVKLPIARRLTKSPSPDIATKRTTQEPGRTIKTAAVRRSVSSSPAKPPCTPNRYGSSETRVSGTKSSTVRTSSNLGTREIRSKEFSTTMEYSDAIDGPGDNHCETTAIEVSSSLTTKESKNAFAFDSNDDEFSGSGENNRNHQEFAITKPSYQRSLTSPQKQHQVPPSAPNSRPASALSTNSSVASASRGRSSQISSSRSRMSTRVKSPISSQRGSATNTKSTTAPIIDANDGLVGCKICGRRFNSDRVSRHEQICTKTTTKKRKQFDATIHRVKGTELEPFVKKSGPKKSQADRKTQKPEVKSNWRRKHEDFINAIRSAKQVQAHLAAGGKLSDLPPPPPSDTSDYVQCPHCGRKFNQAAADRHIPKCQNMMHNKPNPRAPPKPKR